jgi:hypothetical protein
MSYDTRDSESSRVREPGNFGVRGCGGSDHGCTTSSHVDIRVEQAQPRGLCSRPRRRRHVARACTCAATTTAQIEGCWVPPRQSLPGTCPAPRWSGREAGHDSEAAPQHGAVEAGSVTSACSPLAGDGRPFRLDTLPEFFKIIFAGDRGMLADLQRQLKARAKYKQPVNRRLPVVRRDVVREFIHFRWHYRLATASRRCSTAPLSTSETMVAFHPP